MSGNGISDMCDNHPLMNAVGMCEVCGKPVCDDCAVSLKGKYFCNESSHQTISETHTLFCESQNIFEMELIAKNLESNGIPNRWFDRRQYRNGGRPVLFVPDGSAEHARSVLHSLDLMDFITSGANAR